MNSNIFHWKIIVCNYIFLLANQFAGMMFSQLSVCHSVHIALDLPVQGSLVLSPSPTSRHGTSWDPLHFLPGDTGWSSPETCSNVFTSGPLLTVADTWWLLKHERSVQAGGLHPTGMFPCILRLSEFCFTMHNVQEFLTVLRSKKF